MPQRELFALSHIHLVSVQSWDPTCLIINVPTQSHGRTPNLKSHSFLQKNKSDMYLFNLNRFTSISIHLKVPSTLHPHSIYSIKTHRRVQPLCKDHATSRRPKLPHLPISYPNRKAHRVTPGQTVVTPGVKSPRHSGSDASCFEVVANFESCY